MILNREDKPPNPSRRSHVCVCVKDVHKGVSYGGAHKSHVGFIWTIKTDTHLLHALFRWYIKIMWFRYFFIINKEVSFVMLLKNIHFVTTQPTVKILSKYVENAWYFVRHFFWIWASQLKIRIIHINHLHWDLQVPP